MGTIEHIPLLHHQRAIYHLPRGRDRFTHYLGLIRDGSGDLALPLPAFNPMGRDHVAATLDTLIALDAEALAAETLALVVSRLGPIAGDYRLGLVVVDDEGGGWTSRPLSEFDHKFRNQALRKRGWLVAPIWTSEPVSSESIRLEVAATAWRGATPVR